MKKNPRKLYQYSENGTPKTTKLKMLQTRFMDGTGNASNRPRPLAMA
jgi:hypothetical protein